MNLLPLRTHAITTSLAAAALVAVSGCRSEDGATTTTASSAVRVEEVAGHLSHPWALAFLPDGRMLVTERAGRLWLLSADGRNRQAVSGLPPVVALKQGGLLDVSVQPGQAPQATTPWVYWTYSEPGVDAEQGLQGTAVARAQLSGTTLIGVQVVYRQTPKTAVHGHYGSRLAWARDGTLWVTLGERQLDNPAAPTRDHAQNLSNSLGKVVRIRPDGSVPPDNPAWPDPSARPEIYSFGHRNPQGAAVHPQTGELWVTEHGPQGGDELNRIRPGANYGWPLVSLGCQYGSTNLQGCAVGGGQHTPQFEAPLTTWGPYSTAPSGLAFNTGTRYPGWEGQLFAGALSGETLWRIELKDQKVVARQPLLEGQVGRIRDVRAGPDGWLYLLTDEDEGRLLRLMR